MSYSIFYLRIYILIFLNEIVKFEKFVIFNSENDKVCGIKIFLKYIKFGKIIKYFECSSNLEKKMKK